MTNRYLNVLFILQLRCFNGMIDFFFLCLWWREWEGWDLFSCACFVIEGRSVFCVLVGGWGQCGDVQCGGAQCWRGKVTVKVQAREKWNQKQQISLLN